MGSHDNLRGVVRGMTMGVIARDPSGIEGQSHDAGRTEKLVFRTGYRTGADVVYRCKQRWKEWTQEYR